MLAGQHDDAVGIADHDVSVAHADPADLDLDLEGAGEELAGAAHGVVAGEDGEAELAHRLPVADAAVDHQAGDAALLRGHREHLAPVPEAGPAEVGDQHRAGRGAHARRGGARGCRHRRPARCTPGPRAVRRARRPGARGRRRTDRRAGPQRPPRTRVAAVWPRLVGVRRGAHADAPCPWGSAARGSRGPRGPRPGSRRRGRRRRSGSRRPRCAGDSATSCGPVSGHDDDAVRRRRRPQSPGWMVTPSMVSGHLHGAQPHAVLAGAHEPACAPHRVVECWSACDVAADAVDDGAGDCRGRRRPGS